MVKKLVHGIVYTLLGLSVVFFIWEVSAAVSFYSRPRSPYLAEYQTRMEPQLQLNKNEESLNACKIKSIV